MAQRRESSLDVIEQHISGKIGATDRPVSETPGFMTYKPSWVAREFHQDTSRRVRGLMGPIGCGKSHACVMEMFFMAMRAPIDKTGWRRCRFIAVRNTYQQLQDTTERLFFQIFPPNSVGSLVKFLKSDHHATLQFQNKDTGEKVELEVIFRAMASAEDGTKILSINASAAWMNEWDQIPRECHQQVQQRLGRYPQVADLAQGQRAHQAAIIMDYNAPSPDSWYYSFFEEQKGSWKKLYKYPAGIAPDACNLDYLAEGYYETSFHGADEMYVRRYRDNEYVNLTARDTIFTSYRDEVHSTERAEYNALVPLYIGLDFGRNPAAVFAQRDPMGRWLVLDELCGQSTDMTSFAPLLRDKINALGDGFQFPTITGDPAGAYGNEVNSLSTVFDVLASYELEAQPAVTNSLDVRHAVIMSPLNTLVDGVPRLRFAKRCHLLRKAMIDGYHYNQMGKPEKNEYSHPVDALGYCLIGAGEQFMLSRRKDERFGNAYAARPTKHSFGTAKVF